MMGSCLFLKQAVAFLCLAAQAQSFGLARGVRARVAINQGPLFHPLTRRTRNPVLTDTTPLSAVPKRHHHNHKEHSIFRSFLSFVFSPIRRPLSHLGRCFFRFAVYHVSQFTTALLIDPGVNHAIANGIKDGMNLWCTQPHVKMKLVKLQKHLAESEGPSLAKQTGESFPRVMVNFIVGLLLQGLDEVDHKEPKYLTHKQAGGPHESSLAKD